jgi:hypothetical protein
LELIGSWLAAAGTALFGAGALCLFRRRRGVDEERQILRLASDIVAVAATVDADLSRVASDASFIKFANRCRECSERAHEALKEGKGLRLLETERLTSTLLLLHDDHRRMVDLRSELDRALAAWLDARGHEAPQIFKFVRPKRSAWPSSISTRPSTFG